MTGRSTRKQRSPNYPGIDLGAAVEKLKKLFAEIKRHEVGAAVAMTSMGYSGKSSSGLVALGALRAFALVEDVKGRQESMVKLSDRGLDIVADYSPDSPGWLKAVQEAAVSPKIHNELWLRYGSTLPPDDELRRFLIREKGFIDKGAASFIAEYKATIEFAKLAEECTIDSDDRANGDETEPSQMGDYREKSETSKGAGNASTGGFLSPKASLPGTRDFPLYTSTAKGALCVPERMSRKDYDLLKLQIQNSLAVIEATGITPEVAE